MYAGAPGAIFGLRATSSSAGRNACSSPSPCTSSASARFSLVTKLGLAGTLCGSWLPSAIVTTSTRAPPIWRAMSATSGSVATTYSAARAGAAPAAMQKTRSALASREAMTVTPDESGPLQGEALVVGSGEGDLVELEAQALELGWIPGHEARPHALAVGVAERVLRVVRPRAEGEAPREEALDVRVAALAGETRRGGALVVPEPLRAHDRPLIELAGARLVAEGRVDPVESALRVGGHRREGAAQVEADRLAQVEVRLRPHQVGERAPRAVRHDRLLVAQPVVAAHGELEE